MLQPCPQERPGPGEGEGTQKLCPSPKSPRCPGLGWFPCWKLKRSFPAGPSVVPSQYEQESMGRRDAGQTTVSFRARGARWREGWQGQGLRGGLGCRELVGVRAGQGMAGAVGKGQQGLSVQGRAPSEELLEWASGPGSKLGQIWDFLWNFPLPPPCPPSFIFQPTQGPSCP